MLCKVKNIIFETNVQGVRSGYVRVFTSIKIPLWYKCAVLLTLHTSLTHRTRASRRDVDCAYVGVFTCLLVVMLSCCHVYMLSAGIAWYLPI